MSETQYAILEKLYKDYGEKELLKAYAQSEKDIGDIEYALQKLNDFSRATYSLLTDLHNRRNIVAFIAMQLVQYGYHTPAEITDGKPDVKSIKEK